MTTGLHTWLTGPELAEELGVPPQYIYSAEWRRIHGVERRNAAPGDREDLKAHGRKNNRGAKLRYLFRVAPPKGKRSETFSCVRGCKKVHKDAEAAAICCAPVPAIHVDAPVWVPASKRLRIIEEPDKLEELEELRAENKRLRDALKVLVGVPQ